MPEEPFFLVNEFLEKGKGELENIARVMNVEHNKSLNKSVFLKNFTNELFKAYRKTKKTKTVQANLEKERLELKKKLEKEFLVKKKQELINKLKEAQEKIKTIEIPKPTETKELILSKETGKPLVSAELKNNSYLVSEPELNDNDQRVINEIKRVIKAVNLEDKQNFIDLLKKTCLKYNVEYTENYYDKIRYFVVRDLKKYSKISPLLEDNNVKEVVCEGINTPVTITYNDKEEVITNVKFDTEEELNNFINNLAEKSNKKISAENPFLNATINNLNIQATLGSEFAKAKFVITKL